ncbi:MAG: inorganic diphosphatase [Pseudomonadota bacterium]|nr:inorganic diphosphatase [Pseudomonadota bacterium]
MSERTLGPGKNAPEEVDVLIEISPEQGPVKYEVCKNSGRLLVDRFLQTAMSYPCHYGFIPSTLSDDGDPCDVLVLSPYTLIPGSIITVRAVGMLVMEDEAGLDNKILAVPVSAVSKSFDHIQSIKDVEQGMLDKIAHFFKHYKDLDSDKWVKVKDWKDQKEAVEEIASAVKSYTNNLPRE